MIDDIVDNIYIQGATNNQHLNYDYAVTRPTREYYCIKFETFVQHSPSVYRGP